MKGMKRKFFLKRMWSFVIVMLIPALLLVAVTTYMTLTTQMRRMSESNARDIDAVQTNISLVLNSVVTQNTYLTGMTRTNMVMQKALRRAVLHGCNLSAQCCGLAQQHDERLRLCGLGADLYGRL